MTLRNECANGCAEKDTRPMHTASVSRAVRLAARLHGGNQTELLAVTRETYIYVIFSDIGIGQTKPMRHP
jgi:hypothetical protein